MAESVGDDHKSVTEGIQEVPLATRSDAGGAMVVKAVENVALAVATAEQKPSLWTWSMIQLYICLLLATLNAAVNGYAAISIVCGLRTDGVALQI